MWHQRRPLFYFWHLNNAGQFCTSLDDMVVQQLRFFNEEVIIGRRSKGFIMTTTTLTVGEWLSLRVKGNARIYVWGFLFYEPPSCFCEYKEMVATSWRRYRRFIDTIDKTEIAPPPATRGSAEIPSECLHFSYTQNRNRRTFHHQFSSTETSFEKVFVVHFENDKRGQHRSGRF